jgi:hypothetical protein
MDCAFRRATPHSEGEFQQIPGASRVAATMERAHCTEQDSFSPLPPCGGARAHRARRGVTERGDNGDESFASTPLPIPPPQGGGESERRALVSLVMSGRVPGIQQYGEVGEGHRVRSNDLARPFVILGVTPAKAGVHFLLRIGARWIPACAGMTFGRVASVTTGLPGRCATTRRILEPSERQGRGPRYGV